PDEEIYSYTSWEVMEGEGVFSSRVPRAPIYFYSVAALYRVFGVSLEVSRLLSVLASTGTILAIYLISRKLADERVALISAAIFSLSPFTLRYSYIALTEPYEWFFLSFSIYFLLISLQDSNDRYLVISGLLVVLAAAVRRSALAVPIGIFFFLLIYSYREGIKRTFSRLAIYTSSIVIPFGLPLYLAFRMGGGEGLKKFITFKGAEVGHYQDPWWIGIQLSWFAPVLLISLAVVSAYLLYRHTPEGRKRDLLGLLALGYPFLLRTAIPWEWGAESALLLLPPAAALLLLLKKRFPLWLPPIIFSLSALLSVEVFLGVFLKVVIYIFSFSVAVYILSSYINEKYSPILTSLLSALLILIYLRKPEVHLITILTLLPAPVVVSTSILYPIWRRGVWPAMAIAAGSLLLLLLQMGGSFIPLIILVASLSILLLPESLMVRGGLQKLPHLGAYLPLLSLPFLQINHSIVVLTAIISVSYLLVEGVGRRGFHTYVPYVFMLLPLAALIFHPTLHALSAVLFVYLTVSFILLLPPLLNDNLSPLLLFSSAATLGFYMRYAIMTVYTYEFTPASSIFTGGVLRGRGGRALKGVLFLVILSSLLSTAIYSTTPFFERSEPDQHPYMSTVRRVAEIVDERTDNDEYILAWHTFAVEAERKTIIEVSNANYYPPLEVIEKMEEMGVRIFVNDFYLNRLLFEKEVFRNYIRGNFTLIGVVEGIEIYERNQSP
ncbi:MAG: glycosyltransferase family 39 protein, partial [Thermoplasmata archaeon]|nr:glycosyltransferase family 39 protein [Thermoplasmata archaeon]